MLEKVLIPLDASSLAERVLPFVTKLAVEMKQPATLVTVLQDVADTDDLNPIRDSADALIADFEDRRRARATQYLAGIVDQLQRNDVWANAIVRSGRPAEEIVSTATAEHCDLIAMSTHGRFGPERWFLGSVADRVLRTSEVPVLLIRPAEDGQVPSDLNSIVVPLDGSKLAEGALPYAAAIAQACHAPVTLVRAIPLTWDVSGGGGDPTGADFAISAELLQTVEDVAEEYLNKIAAGLREQGLDVRTRRAAMVSALAEIEGAAGPGALIVMTTHGRSGIARTLLGSVTDQVIRSSAAPVLVVRSEV